MSDFVQFGVDANIATITFNRPDKHNAITPAMSRALAEACREADARDDVRVVIVRGAGGRAFSAGSDINEIPSWDGPWAFRNRIEYAALIRDLKKPVIAKLNGWVLGGGFEMALAADIRIADPTAKLGAPEVKRGWMGGGGATQMLPRIAGVGTSMLWLLTGDTFTAEQALSRGIVDDVVAADALDARVLQIAQAIAANAPIAIQSTKAAVRAALSMSLEQGLRYENELHVVGMQSQDAKEGAAAFAQKRPPRFTGR